MRSYHQDLNKRPLGTTGIDATVIGLGLWSIGDFWGPTDDSMALAAIDAAVDLGVNFYDTADIYGEGRSEELLGKAMKGRRKQFFVATKIGWKGYDNKRNCSAYPTVDKVVAGVESNLRRLQTDYIDLLQYHIHYREPNTGVFVDGFQRLKEEGKVLACGMSTSDFDFIKDFTQNSPCATLQIDYSILNRTAEAEIFPYCLEQDIGVIVRAPLAMGILTGKYSPQTKIPDDDFRHAWLQEPEQKQIFLQDLRKVEALRSLTNGRTLAQLALQFAISHPAVTTVIPGGRSPKQVEENVRAGLLPPLTVAELDAIEAITPRGGGRKIWPA